MGVPHHHFKNVYRHSESEDYVTPLQRKEQSAETGPQKTQILELEDKEFKITM